MNKIPRFTYNCSNPYHNRYRCIESDGEIIHHIADIEIFYEALGYKKEMRHAGVLPEEFVWEEYTQKNGVTSDKCLQVKIVDYLRAHSKAFIKRYGDQLSAWMTHCQEGIAEECRDCCVQRMLLVASMQEENPTQG